MEIVFTEDFNDRAVERGVWKGEEVDESLVDETDSLGPVGDEHPLDHAGEDGPKTEPLVGNLAVELLEKFGNPAHIPKGGLENTRGGGKRGVGKVPSGQARERFSDLSGRSPNFKIEEEGGDGEEDRRDREKDDVQGSATALKR